MGKMREREVEGVCVEGRGRGEGVCGVEVEVEVEGVCVERGREVLGGERCGSERGWVVLLC